MAVLQQTQKRIVVQLGERPTAKVVTRTTQTVKITQQGSRGPKGERGEQGPPGPIGTLENLDLPDFTLIFENQLV